MIPYRRNQQPEEAFHRDVAKYLRLALPLDAFWTTIPTTRASKFEGAKLKAKGYRPGTPDILILWRSCNWWLELKAPKGVVSDDQRDAMLQIGKAGGCVGLAKTLDQVEQWLREWGIPLRASVGARPAEEAVVKGAREIA